MSIALIPMAGLGQRFIDSGYKILKPFIKVKDSMMVELVIKELKKVSDIDQIVILVRNDTCKMYSQEIDYLKNKYGILIKLIKENTTGAASTVALGLSSFDDSESFYVIDCDTIIPSNVINSYNNFIKNNGPEFAVITINSLCKKFSFVKIQNNKIIDCVEKKVISSNAIAGAYYFFSKKSYIESYIEYMAYEKDYYSEAYISSIIKLMIMNQYKGMNYKVDQNSIIFLGTPEQLLQNQRNIL